METNRANGMLPPSVVLLVHDDHNVVESARAVLQRLGVDVHEAGTGARAVQVARARRMDLVLIDQCLPDMPGLDVARSFMQEGIRVPWVLTGAAMDLELAFEARKLGALRAVSVPFDVKEVVADALTQAGEDHKLQWPLPPLRCRLREPRSAAERWARLVLLGCEADQDLPTVRDWALCVGVGYSTLREASMIVGVRSNDAKDLMRTLRVLARTNGALSELEAHLVFGDERTLRALKRRAGFAESLRSSLRIGDFLGLQHFVPVNSSAMRALKALIANLPATTA